MKAKPTLMRLPLLFLPIFFVSALAAQEIRYDIRIELADYEPNILTIANNLMDKQYVVDTLYRAEDGAFHFRDTTALAKGIYLAVLSPNNNYFQFLVGNEPPFFSLKTTPADLATVAVADSPDNQLFYDYLAFLGQQREKEQALRPQIENGSESEKEAANAQRKAIDQAVLDYQKNLIQQHPTSFAAAIINTNDVVIPPDYPELAETERQLKQWRYVQNHYFDKIDLRDERLLRTPFIFQRIDHFVHKLNVQHPDTISQAIDQVLSRMNPKEDFFKMYLVHYLNEAAKSNLVGMDAVYVHLIDQYYRKGLAPWTEEELLQTFLENADRLRPLLIGKTAPDISMQKRDGSTVSLHDIDTDFTVLYFWRYDCGQCKKSTPDMKAFFEKWKDKGVTLFAVCTKTTKEVDGCWEYIDENETNDWLHTVDPYMRSRYGKLYDVQSTPSIFVLDKDKKIISKRLGADQLDGLMMQILEQQSKENSQEGR